MGVFIFVFLPANLLLSGCRDKKDRVDKGLVSLQLNPHTSIKVYEGAKTCDECHPGVIADVRASTHYKFLSKLPENHVYENSATTTPVSATHAGKMTKI